VKLIHIDDIMERIGELDGQFVMLDKDLADFFGVAPAELRATVRRNKAVFTVDFVIPVPLSGSRRRSLAFTEHGVIVAASMLGDSGVEAVSIHIVRAFVKLREANSSDADVARRIEVLGEAINALDARIRTQFAAIYEALGMSVLSAAPSSSTGQRLH
jgi:hypothetical protein